MKFRVYTHADFVFAEYVEAESEDQARAIHEDHKEASAASDWEFCDDIATEVEKEKIDLEKMFDIEAANKKSEQERKRQNLLMREARAWEWCEEMVEKLKFLRARGFEVNSYRGGIVDGYPYDYVTINAGGGVRYVELKPHVSSDGSISEEIETICPLPYIFPVKGGLKIEEIIKKVVEL